jgi:xylulokinase
MRYLLGIDLGTQSAKVLLLSEEGYVFGNTSGEYPILTPLIGYAEQDPLSWWLAVSVTIRRLLGETGVDPRKIAGVGLSG